ncbi:UV DNA damage endonuclease [Pacmanvirus S19]|nr:UV DNA damage endonuclease [Pacmanvirus S19]
MLGYACINQTLSEEGITVNRTARLTTIEKNGAEFIKQLVLENLTDLQKILEWNEAHGYRFYRLSSDMISHVSNEMLSKEIIEEYTLDFARDKLAEIGKYAREHAHRLTFHVGQYTLLSSPDEGVRRRSIRDLEIHDDILTAMGLKPETGSVIILHGGGVYGDIKITIDRIRETISNLPINVAKRISLENDERSYDPEDLLPICEEFSIPFCLDVFHFLVSRGKEEYNNMLKNEQLWDRISMTWKRRGIRMKIHISSQRPDSRPGAHADYINPEEINLKTVLCLCKKYDAQIMVEAKQKELAVQRILDEYFYKVNNNGRIELYLNNIC